MSLGITNPAWGRGCLAGITYCRIFANGDVTPCPYLPVSAGNVRTTPFFEIWNNSPLFAALRDPDTADGKVRAVRVQNNLRRVPGPGIPAGGCDLPALVRRACNTGYAQAGSAAGRTHGARTSPGM